MTHDYYARYNLYHLVPDAIAGCPIQDLPEGTGLVRVRQEEGEEFISGKRFLHNYIVSDIVDGYAVLVSTRVRKVKQFLSRKNTLCDLLCGLSYRTNFFQGLDIRYSLIDYDEAQDSFVKKLVLSFDIDKIGETERKNFEKQITPKRNTCNIYVTAFQNPHELIEKFQIDLYKLSQDKVMTFDRDTDKKISLWAELP